MKEVEKLKSKIKRTKWCMKHLHKIILGVGLPATFVGQVGFAISPVLGLVSMLVAVLTYFVGGIILTARYQDSEYLNLLENELYYAEHACKETIETLDKTIEQYKENSNIENGKETKRLIARLIKMKKSAERTLKEIEEIKNNDDEFNNIEAGMGI